MEAYGQSFMQPDISVFQQNLAALEAVNSKWKLFQKVCIRIFTGFSFIAIQADCFPSLSSRRT
jgi:hypothetical protein